jgi:hypothetical protein
VGTIESSLIYPLNDNIQLNGGVNIGVTPSTGDYPLPKLVLVDLKISHRLTPFPQRP